MTSPAGEQLPATDHRWPDPDRGPWRVTLTWRTVDGRPECVGVNLTSDPAGPILTAAVLRKVPIAELIATDRARILPAAVATSGMRRSAVERLQTAADVYQAALRDRRPPTKAVAAHFGISSGGASNLVARARAAGLLPPTSPGVPTG